MNFYPRYPAHYVAKTLHLTMEQDGAYSRLLDWCYMNERPVPHGQRYAIARASKPSEKRAVDAILSEFFSRSENEWQNSRVSSEIVEADLRISAAKANGRKGGRPRKEPESENPLGIPMGIPVGNPGPNPAESSPIPNPQYSPCNSYQTPAVPAAPDDALGRFEGHALPAETPNPAARHAIALNRAGYRCTPYTPDLADAVREGVTVEHLQQIAAWPECQGKPATYVIRIARRERAEPAAPVTSGEPRHAPNQPRESLVDRAARRLSAIAANG